MRRYRPEIDGLRAIAVLSVLLYHAGISWLPGGYVGVDIFFVLSGYLITSIILREQQTNSFSLLHFYEKRARRILPALLTVISVSSVLFYFIMVPGEIIFFSESILAVLTFLSNFFFWQRVDYFEINAESIPLLHTWTLAVEEQFYIVFPVFLIAFAKFKRIWSILIIIFAFIGSLAIAEYGWRFHPTANFYLPFTRGWELLLGALCAYWLQNREEKSSQTISVLGLISILISVIFYDAAIPFPSLYALLPTLGTCLIILTASQNTFTGKLLSLKPMIITGLISYSMYLWHQPLFVIARLYNVFSVELALGLIMITGGISYLSWKYIESPFRDKQKIPVKQLSIILIGMSLILATFSIVTIKKKGFMNSYAQQDRILASTSTATGKQYVNSRFGQHTLSQFPKNDKTNILVIGDSFAKDFVNIIYESGALPHINLSTHHIAAVCGNLFLDGRFEHHINPLDKQKCIKKGWYNNPKLQSLIKEADIIWLASNWNAWVIPYLPESIQNIRNISRGNILVLGLKNFGHIHIRDYLSIAKDKRKNITNPPDKKYNDMNNLLSRTLTPDVFVNLNPFLCSSEKKCRLFTDEGELISYDGVHLTKQGAQYLGQNLPLPF